MTLINVEPDLEPRELLPEFAWQSICPDFPPLEIDWFVVSHNSSAFLNYYERMFGSPQVD
jgi:hypothetical protein